MCTYVQNINLERVRAEERERKRERHIGRDIGIIKISSVLKSVSKQSIQKLCLIFFLEVKMTPWLVWSLTVLLYLVPNAFCGDQVFLFFLSQHTYTFKLILPIVALS